MNILTTITDITNLHRDALIKWRHTNVCFTQQGLLKLIEENHAFNFQLWCAEDRARREDMGFEFVYQAKRDIDGFNQQRNNRMEAIDQWIVDALNPSKDADCPVHSETPGMMIDRLSILSLKSYHMAQQSIRTSADSQHREICAQKLDVLIAQHQQLTLCLQQLLQDVVLKHRTFRVYHQLKMYNDPTLNPELYAPKSKTLAES